MNEQNEVPAVTFSIATTAGELQWKLLEVFGKIQLAELYYQKMKFDREYKKARQSSLIVNAMAGKLNKLIN